MVPVEWPQKKGPLPLTTFVALGAVLLRRLLLVSCREVCILPPLVSVLHNRPMSWAHWQEQTLRANQWRICRDVSLRLKSQDAVCHGADADESLDSYWLYLEPHRRLVLWTRFAPTRCLLETCKDQITLSFGSSPFCGLSMNDVECRQTSTLLQIAAKVKRSRTDDDEEAENNYHGGRKLGRAARRL